MATGVGLSIGAAECAAAVVSTGRESDPVCVLRDSVLHLSTDGSAVLGGIAPLGYIHSVVDFASFADSPAGIMMDDKEPYRTEDFMATAFLCLVNLADEHVVAPSEFYATHPADWPEEHVTLLREALDYLGLRHVALTPSGAAMSAPKEAALEAALLAHIAVHAKTPEARSAETAGLDSSALSMVEAPLGMQAYSAAIPPSGELPAIPASADAPDDAEQPKPRRTVLILGAAAVLMALAGVIAGFGLHGTLTPTSHGSGAIVAATTTRPRPVAPTTAPLQQVNEPLMPAIAPVTPVLEPVVPVIAPKRQSPPHAPRPPAPAPIRAPAPISTTTHAPTTTPSPTTTSAPTTTLTPTTTATPPTTPAPGMAEPP